MDDAGAVAVDAFEQLGIEVRLLPGDRVHGAELLLDSAGIAVPIQVKHRSLVTDAVADRLLAEEPPDAVLLVVGDRVTAPARRLIIARGGGYLDLRGRLALRTAGLVIDAEVEPVKVRAHRSDGLSGRAGLEVATALLMKPAEAIAVRELARELGRSPSTVSEVLAVLRGDGLTDATNTVLGTELFWAVADRWSSPRHYLESPPRPGEAQLTKPLRLGLHDVETEVGWALTDTTAAAAYGAPLALRSGQVLDFLVPDPSIVRRATTLLGAAGSSSHAGATVRVAPVPAAVQKRVDLDTSASQWPLAHPLFVALDLAQDVGRGREILDAWTPDSRWTRVW